MVPPDERLDARLASVRTVCQTYLRLVVQEQLVLLDRVTQLSHEAETRCVVVVDLAVVDRNTVAALLGGVHRDVSVPQQLVTRCSVRRRERDADAGIHADGNGRHLERVEQRVARGLRSTDRHVLIRAGEKDRELVTTETSDAQRLRYGDLEPLAGVLEQRVTRGMAERVVDLLEPVEVEQEDSQLTAIAAQGRDDPLEHQTVG